MTSKNDSLDISALDKPSRQYVSSHIKYEYLIAGTLGGALSALILHPLDLIRTRSAAMDGRSVNLPQYTGLLDAFSTIVRDEGIWGLYRGLTPNILGSGIGWGIYFVTYNSLKRWIQEDDDKIRLSPWSHIMCAAGAGSITLALTNPVWVLKTRLCLQYGDADATLLPKNKVYTGTIDAFKKTCQNEGIRGLYNGFFPGLIGICHGAIHFMMYEEMKNRYNQYNKFSIDTKLSSSEYIAFAAVSKLFATAVTYPYQVVRIRLQDQHQSYKSLRDCISKIANYEGTRGFYKGLCATLLRVVPGTTITFLVFEQSATYLLTFRKEETTPIHK